jgi:hypothetical protein
MVSRAAGKRLRQLRMLPLIAASLVMVLTSVPALAAQATDIVPVDPAAPPGQDDPVSAPPGAAPGVCDHAAGESLVGYSSEEALRAAPPDNVVETFDAALEAARSTGTDDENVAFASEVELDDEASADSSSDSSSADEDDDMYGSASDDAVSGGSGSGEAGGKAADDGESGAGEEADGEESSSGDTEEEDSMGNGPMPVAGKNAAATTSEPHEAGGTGGKVMALGAGALLLTAGVYVAHRTFWS